MGAWAAVRRAYRNGGAIGLAVRLGHKVVRPRADFGQLVFFECDLREALPEPRPVDGIVVRELLVHDLALFRQAGERPRRLALERFERGERCFAGIEAATGKLANYRWMTLAGGDVPELRSYIVLKPGETYIYDLVTLPEFRRRGIDGCVRYQVYTHLQRCGFTRIYAYVHGENKISLRAARALLRPLGSLWYVRLGKWIRIFAKRGPRIPELRGWPFPSQPKVQAETVTPDQLPPATTLTT